MATQHPHFLWTDIFRKNKTEQNRLIRALKENVLFSTLNSSELNYLSTIVYERVYQPGEPIFEQNDRGFGMYLIVKGRVSIRSQTGEDDIQVTTLRHGEFFGELSLVDPLNIRSASAIAIERTELIGFFKPDLMEILERKPSMGVKILMQLSTVITARLLKTTEKMTLISQNKPQGKFHEEII